MIRHFVTYLIISLFFLSAPLAAEESFFIKGSGENLIRSVSLWRTSNPDVLITQVSAELFTETIQTDIGPLQVLSTRGLHIFYDRLSANSFMKNSTITVKPYYTDVAAGVSFIPGTGEDLKANVEQWKQEHPGTSITASTIEMHTDQVWTDEGYVRKAMARGLWIFYVTQQNMPLPEKLPEKETYVHSVAEGIVFIEGHGDRLRKRVSSWKQKHSHITIRSSSVEDFTDHIWTDSGYKRMVVARGMWIFYIEGPVEVNGPVVQLPRPYVIAEDYLKKAVKKKEQDQPFDDELKDAQHWYGEVVRDFSKHPVVSAAELRTLHIKLLLGNQLSAEDVAGQLKNLQSETVLELPVLYDLIDIYKQQDSVIAQLLLYQRIIKIQKNNPYSVEAYEAIKEIERLNNIVKNKL